MNTIISLVFVPLVELYTSLNVTDDLTQRLNLVTIPVAIEQHAQSMDEERWKEMYSALTEKFYDSHKLKIDPEIIISLFNNDSRLSKAIRGAAQDVESRKDIYVSPAFLYSGLLCEGLDELIGNHPKLDLKEIDGFKYLGLHTFGEYAGSLRKEGYLPEDFTKGKRYTTRQNVNEKGETVSSGCFKNIEDAVIAVAAEFAWREDTIAKDVEELQGAGRPFSEEEMQFWTYAYYLGGNGTGKSMLRMYAKKGMLKDESYMLTQKDVPFKEVQRYARKRMLTKRYVEQGLYLGYERFRVAKL